MSPDSRGSIGFSLLALLSVASAVSPFGLTVLVPTLNDVSTLFGVDYGRTQFLISVYLFGLAIGQPIAGALGDRFGRRPVLLLGFALFIAASLGCALASEFRTLTTLRFMQALGVSVGTVCSRAILRDVYDADRASEANAYVAAAMGFAPIVAPVVGGLASAELGVRAVFIISALIGIIVWIGVALQLPETHPIKQRTPLQLAEYRRNYAALLRSRVFVGYTLMFGFGQGIFLAFMAVGAPVFETYLGLGQREFGIVWGLMAVGYVISATLGGRLTRRYPPLTLLIVATGVTLAAGWLLCTAATFQALDAPRLIGALVVLIAANGIISPLSLAGAVSHRPVIAGTASGLSSSLGLVVAGSFTIIAGFVYDGDFTPVAYVMALACTLTFAMAVLIKSSPE